MAFDQHKTVQTVWAVLLIAMGLLLCIKTPYVLQEAPQSGFLHFTRYLIGFLLVLGGARKFYALYGKNNKQDPPKD